jgi:hypothetical protein
VTSRVRVTVVGLTDLRRKARQDSTLAEPFNKAMAEIGADFKSAASHAAPRQSGDMASSFKVTVSKAPVARYVKIVNTAKHRRYPYPARQEFDVKMGHQHWALKAVNAAWSQVEKRLNAATRAIEAVWGR